jgi:hypothetical protein
MQIDNENSSEEDASVALAKTLRKKHKKKKAGKGRPKEIASKSMGADSDISSATASAAKGPIHKASKAKKAVVVSESTSTVQFYKGGLAPTSSSAVDSLYLSKRRGAKGTGAAASASREDLPEKGRADVDGCVGLSEDQQEGEEEEQEGQGGVSDSDAGSFDDEDGEEGEEEGDGTSSSPDDPNADTGVIDFPETQARAGTPVERSSSPPATQASNSTTQMRALGSGFIHLHGQPMQ